MIFSPKFPQTKIDIIHFDNKLQKDPLSIVDLVLHAITIIVIFLIIVIFRRMRIAQPTLILFPSPYHLYHPYLDT